MVLQLNDYDDLKKMFNKFAKSDTKSMKNIIK